MPHPNPAHPGLEPLLSHAFAQHINILPHPDKLNNITEQARAFALARSLISGEYAAQMERDGFHKQASRLREAQDWDQAGDIVRWARISHTPEGHQDSLTHMAGSHAARITDATAYLSTPDIPQSHRLHYRADIADSAAQLAKILVSNHPNPSEAARDILARALTAMNAAVTTSHHRP